MNIILRACRGFLFLILSGCLLVMGVVGQAKALTITPDAPEAYQSFTLEQSFTGCPAFTDPDIIRVDVFPDPHIINLNVDLQDGCFAAPPHFKR